jgi:hypothetical protein
MHHVAFYTGHERWPWLRQTEDGAGRWDDTLFHLNSEPESSNWLVVYDDIARPIETSIPWERRIAVVSEPPGIKTYSKAYLDQFGIVLSPVDYSGLKGQLIRSQPGINWYFGVAMLEGRFESRISYQQLAAMPPPANRKPGVSIVCSKKSQMPMHRERLAFIAKLTEYLGDQVHVFGKGFEEISDKADAILPYRYHIALENNAIEHFWTEKLSDPLLGWALPIYSGCTNVEDYIPEQALIRLDVSDPEHAAGEVSHILEADPYDARLDAIKDARTSILNKHNIFAVIADVAKSEVKPIVSLPRKAWIQPCYTMGWKNQLKHMWKQARGKR